ncbi:MAG: hypothetical protein OXL97_12565 [Chloroflexota bacterium]|nr:hypothetical protein [Chloroflexota bacterium]MDE2883756.1 hypothetical protein [Chloroflexota bacterium]
MRALKGNYTLGLWALAAMLLVAAGVGRGDAIIELHRTSGPYEQDLVRWEITHFPDKWFRLAVGVFSRTDDEERLERVEEFFRVSHEMSAKRREIERALADGASDAEVEVLEVERTRLERRRTALSPLVEETLEGAISRSADDLGVISRFGPVRWPPVDFAFQEGGHVLVRSPRDAIVRLDDRLLTSDISLPEQDELERKVEALDDNVSAIVARIGGVATYPAQVTPDTSLRGALFVASHEWVHHWLIFHPLGRAWFAGGELTSVNETVANIAAEELSDLAFELLTGEVVTREPWQPPRVGEPRPTPEPGVFDFRYEMRETRARLEELLEAGKVDEAEAYLEERRLRFVEQGHNIRKLNTAWFAFHGTYADSPASISPIEPQLRTIRVDSADLAEFLDRVAVIDEAGELERLAREAGWRP